MELRGRTVVVTGGASGIGAALAARAVAEGAQAVVIVDRREAAVRDTAASLGVEPVVADLSTAEGVAAAVEGAEAVVGHVDVWCSNAGVAVGGDLMAPDEGWQLSWDVNVMAGVRAARLLVPGWVERGEGAFISTVSASGLLNHILAATYGATKAAALSFAENLAMTHGLRGVRVLAVCPQGVRTPMLDTDPSGFLDHGAIQPEAVAEAVVRGLADDRRFLVLPHPEVTEMMAQRAENHDRWVAGMRRFRERVVAGFDGDPTDWVS